MPPAAPFEPPPPLPKRGPAFLLKVKGKAPVPFRDLIPSLRYLRMLRFKHPGLSATIIRVVDNAVMAFTVKTYESVKDASANAHNSHMHRKNAKQAKSAGA